MTTASYSTCSRCGAELPGDAPQGVCPKCLLGLGFGDRGASSQGATAEHSGGRFSPPSPEELAPWFPQLEILELLGHGGMGAVYKARQKELDRLVALKILPIEIGRDENFMQRFSREAKALARLDHPNIVTVHDFGRAGDLCYFVMEFVDGLNLRQLRQSGALDPKTALALVPQICEALQYAHDEGVVHRDIKPENILVDKRGRVKIADFGLAKLLGAHDHTLTGSHQAMGTFHYMAPEQLAGAGAVDHRADIYSLGVVFYELLTGNLPVGRFAPPSKKVQIDVRLDEVVLRALEAEPERRYQHASDVKTDVESICGHAGIALAQMPPHMRRAFGYEYRSTTTLLGWPLVHIATGIDPATMKKRVAKGWIAIGDVAVGGLAIAGCAVGVFAIGGCAVGVFTLGGLSLGLLVAFGGMAIGALAMGGGALGIVAIGGGAVGVYAYGGGAFGLHALGGNVRDPAAVAFFDNWGRTAFQWFTLVSIATPFLMLVAAAATFVGIWIRRYREARRREGAWAAPQKPPPAEIRSGRRVSALVVLLVILLLMLLAAPPLLLVGYFLLSIDAPRSSMMEKQGELGGSRWDVTLPAIEMPSEMPSDLASHTWWEMTPDGPSLHASAIRSLQLTPGQTDEINAAMRLAFQDFLKLEEQHLQRSVNKLGRHEIRIEPFPAEAAPVENELWSGIDAVLSPEQQRIARLNLHFHQLEARPGMNLSHLAAPGLFGYARNGARLEMWRTGAWFSWKVDSAGYSHEESAPELPPYYRRFWNDGAVSSPPEELPREGS
jgi:predicted Ser/Thr protein kinase